MDMINDKTYRHEDKTVFMNTTCPIGKWWDQKSCKQYMNFFTREYIAEHTINGNRSYESDKGIENNIHIIITKAENIYQWKKLYEHIRLQVIPPRIIRGKKTSIFIFIPTMKNIEKVFWWAIEKQFVFFHA